MNYKYILFFFTLILTSLNAYSQEFLIPFKSDNKYGLINNYKKIIIEPSFKNIEYIKEDFFEATNEEKYTEKIIFNGSEQDYHGTLILKSILKKDKIIIKDKSIEKFHIYDNYIIGVNNFRNINLRYNQYKKYENIRSYSILFDKDGIESELGELRNIEAFLQLEGKTLFRIQKLDKKYDLIIFDYKKNKVIDVIISNSDDYFFVKVVDNNTKVRIIYEKTKKTYDYIVQKNTLNKKPIEIEVTPSTTIITENSNEERGNKEIHNNEHNSKSSIYVDSFSPKISIYTINNKKIVLRPDDNNLFYMKQKPFIVSMNNKQGLSNINHEEIIPIKYDSIGFNGMVLQIKNFNYYNSIKEYFVLKDDNKYGVLKINQFDKDHLYQIEYFIKPTFTSYPVFYYNDYYGIKNLKLFQVMDNEGNLTHFCDEEGNCY